MPERIPLSRRKGWRKPAGAIVVARPTKWGNPFRIGSPSITSDRTMTRAEAVGLFRLALESREHDREQRVDYPSNEEIRAELAGHDLACWCPLGEPCHADVLLEIANRPG